MTDPMTDPTTTQPPAGKAETYFSDYPTEPIGGGNPYHRCAHCHVSDPQINGKLDGHSPYCLYRQQKETALTQHPTPQAEHTPELLPCPFCRCNLVMGSPETRDDRRYIAMDAQCSGCGVALEARIQYPDYAVLSDDARNEQLRAQIAEIWNQRSGIDDPSAVLKLIAAVVKLRQCDGSNGRFDSREAYRNGVKVDAALAKLGRGA